MPPEPLGEHVAPDEAAHVHVADAIAAGSESVTVAPVTADGPVLDTTIVYVTELPATALATKSVLVIETSAWPRSVSASDAVLSLGVPSITPVGASIDAVFVNVPVAAGLIVAVSV